ncbi:M43 family zinc metalloprotease [Flavivirga aquimarina]|uniref:M43 family zinc metalloprotease n=1 Tax=Flavivirga aquimarina TaxID=2027862 RepID=A0ABT8WAQ1_9FLAO|nr:M43 family zinc metalloprotease [Flavivirga aquimarina]MDO5970148.1 M43 family zinc metalloprotease [Flavivirga aquimarina]
MKTLNKIYFKNLFAMALISLLFGSCSNDDNQIIINPDDEVFYLPVVVHVMHKGESVGEGANLSEERIYRQIEILNEDYRRKFGTRGYNDHPDGGDSKIEFVLAKQDPNGNPINGINRIDQNKVDVPTLGYNTNHFAQYDYWDTSQYINIWTTALPEDSMCLALGLATGPDIDLPGAYLLAVPGPDDKEGIIISRYHFGESDIDCQARYGRTLTHEMGHYLGLLHPWAGGACETNDYCDDTPAVHKPVYNIPFTGCEGDPVMVNNYMNWSDDEVMNVFTNDQIARMHYVLKNHLGRHALLSSPALKSN